MEYDGHARTWQCGELLAQELAAQSGTEAEARLVLEKFASDFADARAARTDVRWAVGAESFPSVRVEGTTAEGRRFTAQMVVVTRPGDARVVQCASRSPTAPCEPILEHLVRTVPPPAPTSPAPTSPAPTSPAPEAPAPEAPTPTNPAPEAPTPASPAPGSPPPASTP